ncbi:MAG: trimethylamine methyltransferase family protein [Fidelibacterota bacterium]|nr:MAG: trimethylamine methyltransferase family protein [Candidatus Neomarinimicrobiota bacterium]
MHVAGHSYSLMSSEEVKLIHESALRILDEVGMEIQNEHLLGDLADFGLKVDFNTERAYFPTTIVERFLSDAEKYDWASMKPRVGGSAGVYQGRYHDPNSGKLVPWNEESLSFYFAMTRHLSHVHGAGMLGCQIPVPGSLEPLYERYYCWKYGAGEGGSIHLDAICPYLLELYHVAAEHRGVPLGQVFRGTVYLQPPLKLGRHEAYQVDYFRERGLRVGIGDMYAMGATAPVTFAGAITLNLAEQIALRILDWALFGNMSLHLGSAISMLDMRTTIYPYGRPEMAINNLMMAQLARHYGASFSGHAGLTDAKLPSVEAGAQKALTAIPTLLAGGSVGIDAGLLSIDQVFSPIQMVLDNEFLSALSHFTREFQITEDTIGLETIIGSGPGGHYLDKQHTVDYFRNEHWEPNIWSREMLEPWIVDGSHLDVDKAREIVMEVQQKGVEFAGMAKTMEKEVLKVIRRAEKELLRV